VALPAVGTATTPAAEQAKLNNPDAVSEDEFGWSVAISGDTAVVSSRFDDPSGSVYVFVRSGTTWTEQAKLTASDASGSFRDFFGWSVSISGDTAVVGSRGDEDAGSFSGSVYVFVRSCTTWTEQAKLTASDAAAFDFFGSSVAISGDTAVIGAHGEDHIRVNSGSAYVFVPVETNQPPLVAVDTDPVVVDEGSTATNTGTVSDPDGDTVTLTASVGTVVNNNDGTWSWSYPTDDGLAESQMVTISGDDGNGGTAEVMFTLTVNNVTPTATFGDDGPVDEGTSFNLSLTSPFDPSSADTTAGFNYAFDCGDGGGLGAFGASSTAVCTTDDNALRSVKGQIKDKDGGLTEYSASVTVNNIAPTITAVTGPAAPLAIGDQPIAVGVAWTDPGTADTHDVTWDWGDASTDDTRLGATSAASETHIYAEPGVYLVTVTVEDDDGGADAEVFEFVVIYDPSAGFVTGGGWIDSPAGAYVAEPGLTGKANFGFVSKYKKGLSQLTRAYGECSL